MLKRHECQYISKKDDRDFKRPAVIVNGNTILYTTAKEWWPNLTGCTDAVNVTAATSTDFYWKC